MDSIGNIKVVFFLEYEKMAIPRLMLIPSSAVDFWFDLREVS